MTRAPAIKHLVQEISLLVRGQAPKFAGPAIKRLAHVIDGRRLAEAGEAAAGVGVMVDPIIDLLPANGVSLVKGWRGAFRRQTRRLQRRLRSPSPGIAE